MTAGKRLRFIALLLALCLAVALPASAAGTASDSLITESWLDDWADELLAEDRDGQMILKEVQDRGIHTRL